MLQRPPGVVLRGLRQPGSVERFRRLCWVCGRRTGVHRGDRDGGGGRRYLQCGDHAGIPPGRLWRSRDAPCPCAIAAGARHITDHSTVNPAGLQPLPAHGIPDGHHHRRILFLAPAPLLDTRAPASRNPLASPNETAPASSNTAADPRSFHRTAAPAPPRIIVPPPPGMAARAIVAKLPRGWRA